jgi:membrane protease subunit (stomatin/prohibitin family)
MKFKAARAMGDAAQASGDGGTTGAGVGLGVGVGLGAMIPQLMREALQSHTPEAPTATGAPPAPGQLSLEERLMRLKAAFDAGLLTEDEYKAKRAKLLEEF